MSNTLLLCFLIISSSYKHLRVQSLRIIPQSKTLPNPDHDHDHDHGVTLDLFHRSSPTSPFYDSSTTLHQRFHSSSTHRHFKYLKAGATETQTTLIPSNGDYMLKIAVGVPPIDIFVILDTSSDLMWFKCRPRQKHMFDPNQSSSYETIPCDSPFCPPIPQMECDSFTNQCQYWYTYGSIMSSLTSGVMAKDLFTLGSINSTLVFGCSLEEDDQDFNANAAGFVGLNAGQFSLISQLGLSNQFSYCLTPSNSNFTSKLRLGSHVVPRSSRPALTAPLLDRYLPTFYVITLRGISVYDHTSLPINRDIFIDTSSTLTYLDPSIYSVVDEAVREAVGVEPMLETPQPELRLCYDKKSGINTERANMVYGFEGGQISLSSVNMFIDLGDLVCLAIVPSEEDGDTMILGNVAQLNFEVHYDLDSKIVSFTPTTCQYY